VEVDEGVPVRTSEEKTFRCGCERERGGLSSPGS
jgi:hypothetical protein